MSLARRTKNWVINILIALDMLGNAVLGGVRRQTISARAAIARSRGRRWGCVLCGILDWLNPGHCDGAVSAENRSSQS